MGKVLKKIIIAIAVMIGAAVVVLVTLMIKSHFDSLKPHLTDDYYTDFKSDYELEKNMQVWAVTKWQTLITMQAIKR